MEQKDLLPINKPQSLKGIAYKIIKDAILTLKFSPGQALSHRQLAAQLQISETPIRDALQDLEREGFVIRIPHKGTFVTEIDSVDIVETFQIRAQLEEMAVRLATPQLTQQDFDEMERLLKLAKDVLEHGERAQCSIYGAQFHQCFIRKANNKRLAAILVNLEDHLQRFRHISDLISGRLEKSQEEHHQVFEAAFQGDAEKAGKAMYIHLDSIVQDVQDAADEWLERVGGDSQ
ncbi:MAG: GntR family transcriptional regulator [Chloroflexi bacterium]|nr:GntR family transcriptional regulator [Chloroflexota bacterium]